MIQEIQNSKLLDTKNTINGNGSNPVDPITVEPEDPTYAQLSTLMDEYIAYTNDWFTSDDIDRQFNIRTGAGKRIRWQALENKVKKGILQKQGKRYRLIDRTLEEIDWQSADLGNVIELKWPFNLEKLIKIFAKSIIIVAGVSGSGKTALLYDFILRNMFHKLGIVLFTNDMGPEEMLERMVNFDISIPNPAPFRVYERYNRFADVIQPNSINVIDYLDLNSEVYMIGQEIDDIYQKLDKGIALIGIQKKSGQALGLGGMFSLKRSKLYLSIDHGELTIEKCRSRADSLVNPKGMKFKFKLVNGCKFILDG